MSFCLACKRKDSIERCTNKSLANFMYCGRHVKIVNVKPWIHSMPVLLSKIVRIQAIWRGRMVRKPLKLAGKGVLKRSICVNDEEMITMDSKEKLHPYDYFSLEEDGTVWFFDQKTMIQWAQKELTVRNPYTRKQLSNEDTARIRNLYVWRRRNKMEVFHEKPEELSIVEKRHKRWMRIVQILREAALGEIHHENFIALNYPQLATLVNSIVEDMRWWIHEKPGRNTKYLRWMLNIRNLMHSYRHNIDLSSDIACVILTILHDSPKIHDFAFQVYTGYLRAAAILHMPLYEQQI